MSRAIHSPWQQKVPRIESAHRHWLTDKMSLTRKLKNHSQSFSVRRINQNPSPLQLSEVDPLQLPRHRRVLQRQVLLVCNGEAAVFAHTVTPLERASRDWPFFSQLGNRSLGVSLFPNPLIRRADFQYTRLCQKDALYQAAQAALNAHGFNVTLPTHVWARRCLFSHRRRAGSRMMVTEVMLPLVYSLKPNL